MYISTHTHIRLTPLAPLSGTTQVSRYQKGKTYLDFTEAKDSEWQWHPLGYMQVCTLLQSDNHASTPPLNFLQARCPSCRPTNSVKALKVDCTEVHSRIKKEKERLKDTQDVNDENNVSIEGRLYRAQQSCSGRFNSSEVDPMLSDNIDNTVLIAQCDTNRD